MVAALTRWLRVTAFREIYQERERLKESRNSLLTAAAQPTATGAAPDDAALQLQQDPQQLQQPGAERPRSVRTQLCRHASACRSRGAQCLTHATAEEGKSGATAHSLQVAVRVTQPWRTGRRPRQMRSSSGRCPRGTLQTAALLSMTQITWRYEPTTVTSLQTLQLPICLKLLSSCGLLHTRRRMLACVVVSHSPSLSHCTLHMHACWHHAAHVNAPACLAGCGGWCVWQLVRRAADTTCLPPGFTQFRPCTGHGAGHACGGGLWAGVCDCRGTGHAPTGPRQHTARPQAVPTLPRAQPLLSVQQCVSGKC
jgi:hypothetical protein